MNCIFITGTDTDAGKTVVSALILKALRTKGLNAVYVKPVQTGSHYISDLQSVYKLNELAIPEELQLNSYSFEKACSPHLAARLEGTTINLDKIVSDINAVKDKYDLFLVEGAGGLMVPLNAQQSNLDLIKDLNCPVILVAANKLGMINHSILTINTLKQEGIHLAGLVTIKTNADGTDQEILKDNPKIVSQLTGTNLLADIDFYPDLSEAELSSEQSANIMRALEIKT